ncbi:phosphotriesterase-related protein [Paenibacillus sp. ACRRX]|uniref:phosphotriesterase family protein n=1 Tax=Paenibacillus sp. ACRRX TaxID=2918206 RepID=UPI001EF47ECF|nr:phosphotriesterase-related protein [Paenibacillus sp. ACRRX]MCG7406968.1 phosphotriesterase-related protein [Paenibacillus sp. ACRRX]
MFIQTVRGSISPECVEATLIHEHIVFDLTPVRHDLDSRLLDDDSLFEEFEQLKKQKCNTIVEVSNQGMGRNIHALHRIAAQHQIHLIAATGYYKQEYYPEEVFQLSEETLADCMIADICEGIQGSGIRAGIIAEIGSSYQQITVDEQKVFRAAARAQLVTGAPLSTHCEIGTMGSEQLHLLLGCGVKPESISFGHQDLNPDVKEQQILLDSGAYIQFDTIGKCGYRSDEERIKQLITLLELGYEDQLMLSCDITRQSHLLSQGGHGYVHLFHSFIPSLKEAGVTDSCINKMLIHNPRRFLTFKT